MVNKLWYQGNYSDSQLEDWACSRNYIQKFIDLYCPDLFSVPEDITTDNLQIFLERILKHYEYYHFDYGALIDIGESIAQYFNRCYEDDFDTGYPHYPNNDRRGLALYVLSQIEDGTQTIFPEDVPVIIKCLNAPNEEIAQMYGYIDNYFKQFDMIQRCNVEGRRRREALKVQRMEAIEKDQPLPIRPMGIILNPCCKRDEVDWQIIRTKGENEFTGKKVEFYNMTGDYRDNDNANKALGIDEVPKGYMWHHIEHTKILIAYPRDIHDVIRYTGIRATSKVGVKNAK